jgi:hypothetical protein
VDDPTTSDQAPVATITGDGELDQTLQRRHALKSRHTRALVRLMDERTDLRGVHALADLVADSLRWSA